MAYWLRLFGRVKPALEYASSGAILLASAAVLWIALGSSRSQPKPPQPPALPTAPLTLAGAETRGSTTAPVALLVFSDFECPYCGLLERTSLKQMIDEFVTPGTVLLAYRHFPLDRHPHAHYAATAAACAEHQGKFWQMHDELFGSNQHLTADDVAADALAIGLNRSLFTKCVANEHDPDVERDIMIGKTLKVDSTPTLFVGALSGTQVKVSERMIGVSDFASLKRLLVRALSKVEAAHQ